jgi:ornithine cyclodeaminase/alanine dehydrogenase
MTVFLTDADVRSVLDWPTAISAIRDVYGQEVDEARYPQRTMARSRSAWLRILSGVAAETGYMGAKMIAVSLTSKRASYLIPLFDQRSAELVALLDANSITGYRTAATSALAADLLSVAGPLDVAVIGSGFEAKNHLRALTAVRELNEVRVFSPREESRARFVDELADLPVTILSAMSAEAAVSGASLVVCAARSRDESPTLHGAWLRPGVTVVSIGSTLPEQREVDPDVLDRADVVVADMVEEVLHDTGDLIAARAAGIDPAAKTTSLADVASGRHPGRSTPDQVVVYKSVGAAMQDIAVASRCALVAEQRGVGFQLPVSIEPVQK